MITMRPCLLAVTAIVAEPWPLFPPGRRPHRSDNRRRLAVTHTSASCRNKSGGFRLTIANGKVGGRVRAGTVSGTVAASGAGRWTLPADYDAAAVIWEGRLRGNTGLGTYERQDGSCRGSFRVMRRG
jgi:hypothetical protein